MNPSVILIFSIQWLWWPGIFYKRSWGVRLEGRRGTKGEREGREIKTDKGKVKDKERR